MNQIIKNTHPTAWGKMKQYLENEVARSYGDKPELVSSLVSDQMVGMAIQSRSMYDILQSMGIDIGIYKVFQNKEWDWFYSIYQGDKEDRKISGKSRAAAEQAGFTAAIELLEGK